MSEFETIRLNGKDFVRCELSKIHWQHNRNLSKYPLTVRDMDNGLAVGDPVDPKTGEVSVELQGKGLNGIYEVKL